VACFLVETYAAQSYGERFARIVSSLREAADELRSSGTRIRHVRSYAVPDDETWFHIFEADSVDGVMRATAIAGVEVDRVVEAIGVSSAP
jgi:hypothetical protein